MPHAIVVDKTGGPDVLQWKEVPAAAPQPGEARVRHTAIGLNFIDVYFRTGLYAAAQLPFTPGNEAAGEVIAVGEGVDAVKVGDRVAYGTGMGAYAEEANLPASILVKLPDGVEDKTAAALMLKGMTAQYLLRRTFRLEPGKRALFHAAAGGVGSIAGQWAKAIGAPMVGTVGSEEKAALAKKLGYEHVINYRTENFVERVKEITDGEGVDVVYDSVGKDTFPGSLDCLKRLGMWVSFGNASGPVPEFSLLELAKRGSLYATRPSLFAYTATRAELEATAGETLDMAAKGAIRVEVNQTFPLKDAAEAHRALEARETTGATVLFP